MGINHQRLDGLWQIAVDPDNTGRTDFFRKDKRIEKKDITVPAVIQEVFPYYDGVAWYFLSFENRLSPRENSRSILKFNAVDYLCEVWLNETYLGLHEDGEEAFSFDVTGILSESNYLAVRVLVPDERRIDGITLSETAHRNKVNKTYMPGSTLDVGGIMQSVELYTVPEVRITDVFLKPDCETGLLSVEITVQNGKYSPVLGQIKVNLSENRSGYSVTSFGYDAELAPGETKIVLSEKIENHRCWSFADPFLYLAEISLSADLSEDCRRLRFGFRDFRVKNGYFFLNGKRIFLKSSHTGNHMPVGILMSRDPEMVRKDLVYAKALGLNAVRFISGVALPEQLDFCDELGLLVYEECSAAWLLGESDKMGERYDRAVKAMILRDRNHPSVAMWGLLNETFDGPVYRHARDFLPELRTLDDIRLVILSSGRWDAEHKTGSVSNPGSAVWEYQWASEGPDVVIENKNMQLAYIEGMGDVHIYPWLPQTPEATAFIRNLSRSPDEKPVFISEYGHASQNNVFEEYRKFAENGYRSDGEDASLYRSMAERFELDWKNLGFDGVYSFAEDFLTASMAAQCGLRQINFDTVRSNPRICGYNITGLLDHGLTGEGLWTYWRIIKPGIGDVLPEGLAPLRWCLFCEKNHVYARKPFRIEAVLANEDVLKPGKYPAAFRIRGRNGFVWQKDCEITLPENYCGGMPPLAVSVLTENIVIDDPGEYEFAATLLSGGAPRGGRQKLYVSDPDALSQDITVSISGIDLSVSAFLASKGVYTDGPSPLTLAGCACKEDTEELLDRAKNGGTVVFLDPDILSDTGVLEIFPMLCGGKLEKYNNWLYHLDGVTKNHPVFAGLKPGALMEADFYDTLFPSKFLSGVKTPDNTLCAAFGVGQPVPGGYLGGPVICEYGFGKGKLVFNTLDILPNLGKNPAADILLLNITRHYL